jgi:hypothetical protein
MISFICYPPLPLTDTHPRKLERGESRHSETCENLNENQGQHFGSVENMIRGWIWIVNHPRPAGMFALAQNHSGC